MAWKIEVSDEADRQLKKLDRQHNLRILKFLHDRLATLDNPRSIGKPLQGPRFGELWRYRVGDYRLICKLEDARLLLLVLRLGDRKEVYR